MEKICYLLLLVFINACTQKTNKLKDSHSDIPKKQIIAVKNGDSVLLDSATNYKITTSELNILLKRHPELNDEYVKSPDIDYYKQKDLDFNSEIGRDNYYLIYAYFLKAKNGNKKFQGEREILIKIYNYINSIYDYLNDGGTYYNHQCSRIPAFAENAINSGINNDYYIKTYNISKQKQLYLQSIKQLITDEQNSNFDLDETKKPELKRKLFKTVDDMSGLITNTFYLKMAQEFQYSNY